MPANSTSPNDRSSQSAVRLEPWDEGDLPLLEHLMKDPAMTEHLGGPQSDELIVRSHARYLWVAGINMGRMFKIIQEATGEAVGVVGYWGT